MNRNQYAYRCRRCNRRIGVNKTHMLTATNVILCSRCVYRNSRPLHSQLYPDCPDEWHDLYDHPLASATRAYVYRVRKIPPDMEGATSR